MSRRAAGSRPTPGASQTKPTRRRRTARSGASPAEGPIYFDTSALAKWYLPEAFSEAVEALIQARAPVAISSLTLVEMRSLLARRRRNRELDLATELRVFATFEQDIRDGHLQRHEADDALMDEALNLISILVDHPLRTLDALQLAAARRLQTAAVATADRVMADAAEALGLAVVRFSPP